jgi:hypothetical protein
VDDQYDTRAAREASHFAIIVGNTYLFEARFVCLRHVSSFRTAESWERRNEMPVSSRRAAAGVAEVGRISIPQLVREAKRLRLFVSLLAPPAAERRSAIATRDFS